MQVLLWNGEPTLSLGGADTQLRPAIYLFNFLFFEFNCYNCEAYLQRVLTNVKTHAVDGTHHQWHNSATWLISSVGRFVIVTSCVVDLNHVTALANGIRIEGRVVQVCLQQ